MRSLVTGASGFIGFALARHLAERGGAGSVVAAVGPPSDARELARRRTLEALGLRVMSIDLTRPAVFAEPPPEFETLFHLAAFARPEDNRPLSHVNDKGTENLLHALSGRLKGARVVFTGTIAVEMKTSGPPAHAAPDTGPASCSPLTAYGQSKLRAETIVQANAERLGYRYTTVRLPTVYGVGARGGGMFGVLPPLLRREAWLVRINWPGRIGLIHVDDTASLLAQCAGHHAAANRTFLVNSGEDPTFADIARHIAQVLGVPYRPIRLPPKTMTLVRRLVGAWWLWRHAPHPLKIAIWRTRHVIDGLTWDGSELTGLLNMHYRPWQQAVAEMYAEGGDRYPQEPSLT